MKKEKGTKRSYNSHGCSDNINRSRHGPIRENPREQVNALPDVGMKVIVYECVEWNNMRKTGGISAEYLPMDSYKDVNHKPRVFVVEKYTRGQDHPFDRKNSVCLTYDKGNAHFRQMIPTVWIAVGAMLLRIVDRNLDEMLRDRLIIGRSYYGGDYGRKKQEGEPVAAYI